MEQSTATLERTTVQASADDRHDEARGHIRAALRELAVLNVSINAYASDDQFGQPNQATAAMDELTLALAALS